MRRWIRWGLIGVNALIGVAFVAAVAQAAPAKLKGPSRASVGSAVSVDATGFVENARRYTWNWGDGTFEVGGAQMSHVYTAPGDYTITVDIVAEDGTEMTATLDIVVGDDEPVIEDTSPAIQPQPEEGSTAVPVDLGTMGVLP